MRIPVFRFPRSAGEIFQRHGIFLMSLFGFAAIAFAGPPALPKDAIADWERHCQWRIARLSESYGLTSDQGFAIRSYLEEQQGAMDLFEKFGQLDELAQKRKVQEIYEVTVLKIEMLLLPAQRDLWKQWETQFGSRKAISRGGDALFRGRHAGNLSADDN